MQALAKIQSTHYKSTTPVPQIQFFFIFGSLYINLLTYLFT